MADLTPQKEKRRNHSLVQAESLVGRKFGEYTVIRLEEPRVYDARGAYIRRYVCRCSCGGERAIASSTIKGRPPYSCIKCRRSRNLRPTEDFRAARCRYSKKNLETLAKVEIAVGAKIGWFTVITEIKSKTNQKLWRCRCECGQEVIKTPSQIRYSTTTRCRTCSDRRKTMHVEVSALSHVINGYRQRARRRNLVFELSRTVVLQLIQSGCSYCGEAASNTYKKPSTGELYHYNGIDRVNPAEGYIVDNVVTCCSSCNVAKLDRSRDEFVAHARRITEHLSVVETRI